MLIVYDSNMKKLAYLENAYDVWYDLKLNELWTCGFTLPRDDKKNQYCEPYNYIELYDGDRRIELFRIMQNNQTKDDKNYIKYECEHVLATLLDDIMFQYHQIGNLGVYTRNVIRYVLDRQTTPRWQLYECDFSRQFEYKWENENLLAALFSIPQPFQEKYRWEYNTTGSTWRISLKDISNNHYKADIQYKKNMKSIVKESDATNLVTRMYLLGYGEGDNQLTVKSVNNNIPYIERNTAKYGLKSSVLIDRRFEHAKSLLEYGKAMLNELSEPFINYKVETTDLYRVDKHKYEPFFPGDNVLIRDREDNIDFVVPIIQVSKKDVTGNYLLTELEIANKSRSTASTISELQNRARINETYSQGATNLQQIVHADNADKNNGLVIKFYIPTEMARINKLILNYTIEPFRAYIKGNQAGGAVYISTGAGGGQYKNTTTSAGGGSFSSTGAGGGMYRDTESEKQYDAGMERIYTKTRDGIDYSVWIDLYIVRSHSHGFIVDDHTHQTSTRDHTHQTAIDLQDHRHQVITQDHSHPPIYGIYQSTRASRCYLKIDGTTIYNYDNEVNIIPYLSKDGGGKIRRGTWHTVEIIPDTLTRINASLFIQLFTNSRGGGDF